MFSTNEQFAAFFKSFQPVNAQLVNPFQALLSSGEQLSGLTKNFTAGNEQVASAVKAGLDAQISYVSAVTMKAVESSEKLADLNMSAAKASMDESAVIAKQLLASKDPQEVASLVAALPQPTATKALAYGRHVADIATAAQAEFARATEENVAQAVRMFSAFFQEAAKNAPAGSENAIALVNSAITNANAGIEQAAKISKQATEAVQANINATVEQAAQATEQAAASTGRNRK